MSAEQVELKRPPPPANRSDDDHKRISSHIDVLLAVMTSSSAKSITLGEDQLSDLSKEERAWLLWRASKLCPHRRFRMNSIDGRSDSVDWEWIGMVVTGACIIFGAGWLIGHNTPPSAK